MHKIKPGTLMAVEATNNIKGTIKRFVANEKAF